MKLDGLPVNTVISEFKGPHFGVNYGGNDTAYCVVILQRPGTGAAVKVQYNVTPMAGFYGLSPTLLPNPANWVDVATINTYGLTRQAITVRDDLHWLRVIVSTAGTGTIEVGGLWAKPHPFV